MLRVNLQLFASKKKVLVPPRTVVTLSLKDLALSEVTVSKFLLAAFL